MRKYNHLSEEDRWKFYELYHAKMKMSEIAEQLGRHRSSLYRELKRNTGEMPYRPSFADALSHTRRSQSKRSRIDQHQTLKQYIHRHLKNGWSPEQIAGRLKRKKSKYTICHETIYQYIYRHPDKKLYQYLRYKNRKRRPRFSRKKQQCRYGEKRLITQRPSHIDNRIRWGHWEGDTIEFCGTKRKLVTTLVERKSRMVILIKNETKCAATLLKKIHDKMKMLPKPLRRTVTFDQGAEFGSPQILESLLECRVYYCHTHSPWEKGANENMNGRLRQYLPRCMNIQNISQGDLDRIADIMNATPRKCLGYKMPKELFNLQVNSICRT